MQRELWRPNMPRIVILILFCVLAGETQALAAPVAPPSRAPAAAQTTAPPRATPAPASSAERARYAARDAASPGAKNFRGGDDVVIGIGATTATVVLAVILLVVLL
jgi:hypothetical protein